MTHTQGILAALKEGEEDEDVPEELREDLRKRREELEEMLVTPVAEIKCPQCGGRSLLAFDNPDDPGVAGTRWACPHCDRVEHIQPSEVVGVDVLASHPGELDASDSLEDHVRATGHGGPERWAVYREVVIKGRPGASVARERGVEPTTVYSHVSRAKDAIREVRV